MLRIETPFHGAVMNSRHGRPVAGGLKIAVRGEAPPDARVTVNDALAHRDGAKFSAEVVLTAKETDIIAVAADAQRREERRVRVVWDRHSRPRYRVAIDDNSFFLRDIAQKGYVSLFDSFYLKGLRELNRRYGAKFVLNIYYTTGDDFSLPQFPDRYKGEWRDNADWLKLAFHAHADKPDRPYENATPEKLAADFDQVAEQIRRFAGEETYSPPTIIHWGIVQPSAFPVLARRAVRVLSGYFRWTGGSEDANYLFDRERCEWLSHNEALKDFDTGIVFSLVDLICNLTPVEKIVPALEAAASDPCRAEIMDILTHEQYFWPFYHNHIPDHFERLEAAVRWLTEHDYRPVFFHEGLLGVPE
ncbi:MAG: hypothetical protein N2689_03685 [Verrucomicrobiae bacterium]|nr:hypothetical protein [Verrucomicrobiae bacterium]